MKTTETFLLVHSPVAGPRTWEGASQALARHGHRVIVPVLRLAEDASPPYWSRFAEQAARSFGEAAGPVILVAHSAAGPLLPAVAGLVAAGVRCCLFVDATVPARTGPTPVVPAQYLEPLRALARDGRLPPWSKWWGDDAMASLIPERTLRREIEEEMPSLPLGAFEETVPVPAGWPASPCGYLHLSPPYEPEASEARSRGWPVTHLPGGHFHMAVDPDAVAAALLHLTGTLVT